LIVPYPYGIQSATITIIEGLTISSTSLSLTNQVGCTSTSYNCSEVVTPVIQVPAGSCSLQGYFYINVSLSCLDVLAPCPFTGCNALFSVSISAPNLCPETTYTSFSVSLLSFADEARTIPSTSFDDNVTLFWSLQTTSFPPVAETEILNATMSDGSASTPIDVMKPLIAAFSQADADDGEFDYFQFLGFDSGTFTLTVSVSIEYNSTYGNGEETSWLPASISVTSQQFTIGVENALSSSGLPVWAISLIVILIVLCIVIVVVVTLIIWRRRKNKVSKYNAVEMTNQGNSATPADHGQNPFSKQQ